MALAPGMDDADPGPPRRASVPATPSGGSLPIRGAATPSPAEAERRVGDPRGSPAAAKFRDASRRHRSRHWRVADAPRGGHLPRSRAGGPLPGSAVPRIRRRRSAAPLRSLVTLPVGAGGRFPARPGGSRRGRALPGGGAGGGRGVVWLAHRAAARRSNARISALDQRARPPSAAARAGRSVPDSIPARSASAKPASGSENTNFRVGRPRGGPPPPTPEKPGTIPMREEWTT